MKPPFEDYLFISFRLDAKEAYKAKGGDLDELQSYSIRQYVDSPMGCHTWTHTAPVMVEGRLQRTVEYSFMEPEDSGEFETKAPIGKSYLLAKKTDGKTDVINISCSPRRIHPTIYWREVDQVDRLNRPIYKRPTNKKPKNKRQNAFRAAVRQAISTPSSSQEELKSPETSQQDTTHQLVKKLGKENSKHQGKAKTFKRKTKRRGRV